MRRIRLLFAAFLFLPYLQIYAQDQPWHIGAVPQANAAMAAINTINIKPGSHQIVVAVIDSGVITEHPSLQGVVLPGYDMLSPPNNLRGARSSDVHPDERDARCGSKMMSGQFRTHGTEVSSLIAGNGVDGVYGVNTKARILPIRLFGACGMRKPDLLDAISWAAGLPVAGIPLNPHPARVINLSLAGGGMVCSPPLQELINQLTEKKIFVVAAAGNNFHRPLPEPANCQGVISVGAVDAENRIEVYSAMDKRTVLYAPGGGKKLSSSEPWGENKLMVASYDLDFFGKEKPIAELRGVGTSFAAPVVAGFVSLWLSRNPEKSPADFWQSLPQFLRKVEPIEKCPECVPMGLNAGNRIIQQ